MMLVTIKKDKEELVLKNPSEDILAVVYKRSRDEYDANFRETMSKVHNFLTSSHKGKRVFKSKPIEITVEKSNEESEA